MRCVHWTATTTDIVQKWSVCVMSNLPNSEQQPPEELSFTGSWFTSSNDPYDRELEDLVFSWRRITDPKLRMIALGVNRSMASGKWATAGLEGAVMPMRPSGLLDKPAEPPGRASDCAFCRTLRRVSPLSEVLGAKPVSFPSG